MCAKIANRYLSIKQNTTVKNYLSDDKNINKRIACECGCTLTDVHAIRFLLMPSLQATKKVWIEKQNVKIGQILVYQIVTRCFYCNRFSH